VRFHWVPSILGKATFELHPDGTGSNGTAGESITWTQSGTHVTIVLNRRATHSTTTYRGVQTANGLCSAKAPCKMVNPQVGSGTWYAIRK
jgi:hypothetical protein